MFHLIKFHNDEFWALCSCYAPITWKPGQWHSGAKGKGGQLSSLNFHFFIIIYDIFFKNIYIEIYVQKIILHGVLRSQMKDEFMNYYLITYIE